MLLCLSRTRAILSFQRRSRPIALASSRYNTEGQSTGVEVTASMMTVRVELAVLPGRRST